MPDRRRLYAIVGTLVLVVFAAAFVLQRVFATVFFAITVAYVLYPVRQFLARHGFGRRVAAAISTALAFVAVVVVFTPLVTAFYLRRESLFEFLRQLPDEIALSAGEFSYSIDVAMALTAAQEASTSLALALARQIPAITFKAFLFTLVVYALLVRPGRLREALFRPVPREYHDIVLAFHQRTRSMLYGIYVLQAAVAAGTFLTALVVFTLLGYQSTFTLAVLSGILQFIPIIGPSILILVIGLTEALAGNVNQAALVVAVGLVVVGFLPDVVIRPRLASFTTDIPASLYFIGFTGGTLSVGIVGLVAGPLVVAWLTETVSLLSAETGATTARRTTLEDWAPPDATEPSGDRPVEDGDGSRPE